MFFIIFRMCGDSCEVTIAGDDTRFFENEISDIFFDSKADLNKEINPSFSVSVRDIVSEILLSSSKEDLTPSPESTETKFLPPNGPIELTTKSSMSSVIPESLSL